MATTIQRFKEKNQCLTLQKTMFGYCKGIKSWSKKERMLLREI